MTLGVLLAACAAKPVVVARPAPPFSAAEARGWQGYLDSVEGFLRLSEARLRGLAVLEVRSRLAENLGRVSASKVELPRHVVLRAGRLITALDRLFQRVSASTSGDSAPTDDVALPTVRLFPTAAGEPLTGDAQPAPGAPNALAPEPDAQISEAEMDDGGPAVDIVPPPPEPGSYFRWPLASARVTSRFGYRTDPIHKRLGYHDGVDLSAPRGTTVLAAAQGRVTFAGRRGGAGNLVVLLHGNGSKTLYAHLDRVLVAPGASIPAGGAVGLVGATGRATGPHLHFVVRWNGKLVDPLAVVGKSARQLASRLEP